MRIWKCDMCGLVIENGEDVMQISCRDCSDKVSVPYPQYEVCRLCAKDVNKFLKKEWTPNFYSSLRTIYNYCRSESCEQCLLNENRLKNANVSCMVGRPELEWIKSYPCLKEGDPE